MKSKITGFIVSPTPTGFLPAINPSIRRKTISGPWGHLTLFSTGDNIEPVEPGLWSLGFPPHTSLMDHNLLIRVTGDGVTIENDWLASIPVYFNVKEKIISTFPDICLPDIPVFDDEGLYLYLKYGFAALGTTPFSGVHTLRYFSALHLSQHGISVTEKEDPLISTDLSARASEKEIWEMLSSKIENVLDQTAGPVITPLSGGYDSRIINALVPERHKDRNKCYSYGISPNQEKCFESQIARKVADRLGYDWKQIHLSDAYRYTDQWHDLFGFATHLHGMMHIEFFRKILDDLSPEQPTFMFTGISGSAFQGGHPPKEKASRPSDIYNLALTHQLNFNAHLPARETEAENRFFEQNKELLNNLKWYPVLTMRIKMNLLHYLFKVPASMGIPSTTPYHDFEIAKRMLSLPEKRRQNREWVVDYFKEKDLHFSTRALHGDTRNTLNRQLFRNFVFQPLTPDFWEKHGKQWVHPHQVEKINKILKKTGSIPERTRFFLTTQRVIKEILKKAGVVNTFNRFLYYWATLKAIEKSVLKKTSGK
ncbi:MAG: asparagine synthase-related protein [Bacteroidota bacterium]